MKRSIQLVALVIAAMLATQPALADILCLAQDGAQPMDAHACCAGMDNTSVNRDSQNAAAVAPVAQSQSGCSGGCCSVLPQNPAPPNPAVQAKAIRLPLAVGNTAVISEPAPAFQPWQRSYSNASAPARRVLLQVFRI